MITANAGLRLQHLRVTIADKNGNFTSTVINLRISLVQFQMIGAPRRLAAMAQSLQKITNTVVLVQGAFHLVQSVPVFGAWCIYSVAVMTCQLFADHVISTACCSLTADTGHVGSEGRWPTDAVRTEWAHASRYDVGMGQVRSNSRRRLCAAVMGWVHSLLWSVCYPMDKDERQWRAAGQR